MIPLDEFARDMRTAKLSPITIEDRLAVLHRLSVALDPTELLDATGDHLRGYQAGFAHLMPASVDIYTRHIRAFYHWAYRRRLIERDPSEDLISPMAYVLASFAGLRRGEICRAHRRDLNLTSREPTALVHGKGGKERIVPLLPAVITELEESGLARGWLVHLDDGSPYPIERLSAYSSKHLHGLGLTTTLHSMRHTFATNVGRLTRDPMFVRDLLGHASVATTEIYMQTSMRDAHMRLASWGDQAIDVLDNREPRLRSVSGA